MGVTFQPVKPNLRHLILGPGPQVWTQPTFHQSAESVLVNRCMWWTMLENHYILEAKMCFLTTSNYHNHLIVSNQAWLDPTAFLDSLDWSTRKHHDVVCSLLELVFMRGKNMHMTYSMKVICSMNRPSGTHAHAHTQRTLIETNCINLIIKKPIYCEIY